MNTNIFNGMFGKVAPGMCRLSMSGKVAVKTDNGYKSYDISTKKLTNCDSFVFDIGEEFFFVIPTNKVKKGDIILVGGKPKCVIDSTKESIKVIDYEDSSIKEILPERHMFMGNTYFYGKIVSMFGDMNLKGKGGMNKMFKYMMMSEMLKGGTAGNTGMGQMLPFMMLSGGAGGFEDMFSGMFDLDDEDDTEEE